MRLFGKNKRGIQLAVNFLVTFILAVVIFGAGLVIMRAVVFDSGNSIEDIQAGLDDKIEALSCSAKDKLCISNNEATISRDDKLFFGVHVNNYLSTPIDVRITIDIVSAKGFTIDEETIEDNIPIKPLPVSQEVTIAAKQQVSKGFAMIVPKETTRGQYFYTIRVTDTSGNNYPTVSDTLIFTVK